MMKPVKVPRPIFHAHPIKTRPLMIIEVEEHLAVCRKMSKENAREYMYSLNLDYDCANNFLPTIKYLEQCYYI